MHVSQFQLEPVWWQFYWWIVGLNIFQFGTKLINLLYGAWQDPQPWMTMLNKVLGLIPIVILFNHPVLFSLKHPELDQQQYGATLDLVNSLRPSRVCSASSRSSSCNCSGRSA